MHELADRTTQSVVHIVAKGKRGNSTLELHEGESALVGNAVGCQLRLEGEEDVAPHQCMLQLLDGILILDNWCADNTTNVNGKSVQEQVTLGCGDTISFGSCQLQFSFDSPAEVASSIDMRSTDASQNESDFQKVEAKVESVESSTIAVLYSEISFLQRELEQRDAALTLASTRSDGEAVAGENHSNSRLNELLAELEVMDRRLLGLTDEIRLLEDLRAAEREEHRQITEWVNDVENLIARRDQEQLAQMDRLRDQLEQEKEDRQFQQRRADALVANSGKKELQVALNELRMEYESLRENHKDASDRVEKLQAECETLRAASTDSEVERRIHEAVRAEQLELTQERAKLSRREHELAVKLRQLPVEEAAEQPNADEYASTGELLVNLSSRLHGARND